MVSGMSRATPRPDFRACSTCAITAIRNSFRYGRWRATAISRAAIPRQWRGGCRRPPPRSLALDVGVANDFAPLGEVGGDDPPELIRRTRLRCHPDSLEARSHRRLGE